MSNLLVVVDMINGFVNFGNLADKKINKIVPNVESLIKTALSENDKVVAFCDSHSESDEEFKTYPVHCLDGSEESELILELKKYENNMQIIKKQTTDGFQTEEFKELIKNKRFNSVSVCGCCTDICVQDFCISLKKYFIENNIPTVIFVFEEAVYTFDGENHNADEFHKKSLDKMRANGIIVL